MKLHKTLITIAMATIAITAKAESSGQEPCKSMAYYAGAGFIDGQNGANEHGRYKDCMEHMSDSQ